jgi:low temperature requirement protein LtrA
MAARAWWQPPGLRDEDQRSVGWLELFFDLVFVVVISRLALDLAQDHSTRGTIEFGLQFFGVFWAWNAFTYYTERFETAGLQDRLLTLLSILPVAAMALYAQDGLRSHYAGFTMAYLVARAVNMIEWGRAARHVKVFRPVAAWFIGGFGVVTVMMAVGFVVRGDARMALWGAAVVVDVATPSFTLKLQAALPPISRSKFPERFGTFTMIVLGESVNGVINGLSTLNGQHRLSNLSLVAGALGITIGFGLWWVYFDFIARRPSRRSLSSTLSWVYLHLAAVAAITVTGAGISVAILEGVGGALTDSARFLVAGGLGGALVAIGCLETTLDRAEDEPTHAIASPALKIGGGLAAAVVGCLPLGWDMVSLLAFLLAVLVGQATYGAVVWFRRHPIPAPADDPAVSPG